MLTTIFTSTVVATIISYLVAIFLKRLDFRNEYFKYIIEKRLEAYQAIERFLEQLSVGKSNANGEYHEVFDTFEKYEKFEEKFYFAGANSLWINKETFNYFRVFNDLVLQNDLPRNDIHGLVRHGLDHFEEICEAKKLLEEAVRNDLLTLYDFKKFKKSIEKK